MSGEYKWSWLFHQLRKSGCAKKQVACATLVGGLLVHATNRCEFKGAICPRLDMSSGQGYELCQAFHAEAELARALTALGKRSDGIAWLAGHYWACEPCASALKAVGVTEIRIMETPSSQAMQIEGRAPSPSASETKS